MKQLLPTLIPLLILFSCNRSQEQVITYVQVNGKKIPEIHFDRIPADILEIGLSELITDYRIIPLETKDECLVTNTKISIIDNKLLIGTQHFPDPAPVYMFDLEGNFIREVGKGGSGPGEHIGYMVESIQYIPDESAILINFQDWIQLFDSEGEYIDNIKQPFDLMDNVFWYSDHTWFSTGSSAGYPHYPRDSVLLVMHDKEGSVIKTIPRVNYPPKAMNGYTPSGWNPSVYRYNNSWKIYLSGTDTIFKLAKKRLLPVTVLDLGEKRQKYNEITDPGKVPGTYRFSIVAENNNHWIFRNSEITKAEIIEYRPGLWGGHFDTRDELAVIDKKSNKAVRIVLKDDVFGITGDKQLNNWTEFIDNDKLVYSIQASDIKKLIKERLETGDADPVQKERLEELDNKITEDSNPVIFIFYLKDRFSFI